MSGVVIHGVERRTHQKSFHNDSECQRAKPTESRHVGAEYLRYGLCRGVNRMRVGARWWG